MFSGILYSNLSMLCSYDDKNGFFVSQNSKCKNLRKLFGEVAVSLSKYVQF